MTPIVDGKTYRFAARGLYNGLVLIGDYETHSFWDHITGECVHGPLKGAQLEATDDPLLQMSVKQALAQFPDARIAISKPSGFSIREQLLTRIQARLKPGTAGPGRLGPGFTNTMGEEDTRRNRMDVGLGVWTNKSHRYYPLDVLREAGNAIIDTLGERNVLIYIDPDSSVPAARYTNATECHFDGEALQLNTGNRVCHGKLQDAAGNILPTKHPQQLFTRWYGFVFTFPGCEIYESEEEGVKTTSM